MLIKSSFDYTLTFEFVTEVGIGIGGLGKGIDIVSLRISEVKGFCNANFELPFSP